MELDCDAIVSHLRDLGDHDRADKAEKELPEKVYQDEEDVPRSVELG